MPLAGSSRSHPSFHIDPEKNLFFCYGCQRGGDIFTYLELIEGVDFHEALQILKEIIETKAKNHS